MAKSPLKDFFDFSRREQTGLLLLVGIIMVCLLIISLHDYIFPRTVHDYSDRELALAAAIEAEQEKEESLFAEQRVPKRLKKVLPEPFAFNPSALNIEGYMSLGFSEKQAASIRRYFDKGGRINRPEDFQKLYVVNDFMFQRLKDYIVISTSESSTKASREEADVAIQNPDVVEEETRTMEPAFKSKVNLNTATEQELIALKGIGPIYASRILKYRDLLGGYSHVTQISEVYGLDKNPDIAASLIPQLSADGAISPIDLNTAQWEDFVRHPYIDKHVANSLISMREAHGHYKSADEVLRSHLVDETLFEKLGPYLTVGSR